MALAEQTGDGSRFHELGAVADDGEDAHGGQYSPGSVMSGTEAVKTLLGGAVVVLGTARDVASHAAWWLRYQVEGTAHDGDDTPAAPKPSGADS